MDVVIMKENKPLIVALLFGGVLAVAIFVVLKICGSNDATLFASFVMGTIAVAAFISPGRNLMDGLRRVWLFDLVAAIIMPIFFVASAFWAESFPIMGATYVSYLVYFLAGVTIVRRFLGGRR